MNLKFPLYLPHCVCRPVLIVPYDLMFVYIRWIGVLEAGLGAE